jgi:hypothetical protein
MFRIGAAAFAAGVAQERLPPARDGCPQDEGKERPAFPAVRSDLDAGHSKIDMGHPLGKRLLHVPCNGIKNEQDWLCETESAISDKSNTQPFGVAAEI